MFKFPFALEHFFISCLEIIENEAWCNLNIEVSHIIKSMANNCFLFNEVKHLSSSHTSIFSWSSHCGVRSLIVKFYQNVMSHLFKINSSFHPWMGSNLINSWSLFTIIAEHFNNKILKFGTEVLATSFLPVGFEVTFEDQVVEVLILLGFLEWEYTLDDDK